LVLLHHRRHRRRDPRGTGQLEVVERRPVRGAAGFRYRQDVVLDLLLHRDRHSTGDRDSPGHGRAEEVGELSPVTTPAPVRGRAVRLAILGLAALGLVAAVYTVATTVPARNSLYPKCVTYTALGVHCPGCGTGRAAHFLLNGHPLAALQCNVFAPFFLP